MIILITGATHSGKTRLAQILLEKYKYPYVCQDHIKMGLIRSGNIGISPENSDEVITEYLWPVTREMVKTAIENNQNLIIEGCYIPFDWMKDFNEYYLPKIKYICLCLSNKYIDEHFDSILEKASCIEQRMEDDYCTSELIKRENRRFLDGCIQNSLPYILIDNDYEKEINNAI